MKLRKGFTRKVDLHRYRWWLHHLELESSVALRGRGWSQPPLGEDGGRCHAKTGSFVVADRISFCFIIYFIDWSFEVW